MFGCVATRHLPPPSRFVWDSNTAPPSTRHIISCLSALVIMSHTTLAQGVSARHTIHMSCACVSDLSSTLSSHSSLVSPIFYFILLIFHFIFHVDRFGVEPPVRFLALWSTNASLPGYEPNFFHACHFSETTEIFIHGWFFSHLSEQW